MEGSVVPSHKSRDQKGSHLSVNQHFASKPNQVGTVLLYGVPIVSLVIDSQERLCLAQISNTLLKQFSYNEIHNRRVALGITCVQCTPVQLEILRRAGAMPVSSRRCGMITRREAERLCKSFLGDNAPPRLPDDFAFSVHHECAWGCRGAFLPSRYNSSRAKCIKCTFCGLFFSPNKFIFHSHRTGPGDKYIQPDAANFNSWRRHMKLSGNPPDEIIHAWEDVKAMFNGGTRKRLMASSTGPSESNSRVTPPKQAKINNESPTPTPSTLNFPVTSPSPAQSAPSPRVPPFPEINLPLSRSLVMDYVWHQSQAAKQHQFPFSPYTLPWLKRGSPLFFGHTAAESSLISFHRNATAIQETKPAFHQSAFRPVQASGLAEAGIGMRGSEDLTDDETVDIETTEEEELNLRRGAASPRPVWSSPQRIDSDRSRHGDSSCTPVSSHSITAVHSSPSPVLKTEADTTPPPSAGLLPSTQTALAAEAALRLDQENTSPLDVTMDAAMYDRGYLRHDFRDRIAMDHLESRAYQREPPSPQERLDFSSRDSLWSVARLSLERQDRGRELYRPDIAPGRCFIDSRDKEHLQGLSSPRSGLTKGGGGECPSCPACRPPATSILPARPQTALLTGENNNKISTP